MITWLNVWLFGKKKFEIGKCKAQYNLDFNVFEYSGLQMLSGCMYVKQSN